MSIPLLTEVRALARGRMVQRRDLVMLAIDGIPYELGVESWPDARLSMLRSVFPSTSSSAWLSSLTGADVATHGVPGVVFKVADADMINVFDYQGDLGVPRTGNIFDDATAEGFEPIAILGDCEPFDCSWRASLLRGAALVRGWRFFTAERPKTPEEICADALRAIRSVLAAASPQPRLIWCLLDADRLVHRRGYDGEVRRFLRMMGDVAAQLASAGAHVIAYSDHGLVPTRHDAAIAAEIERVSAEERCAIGGAGRTRWIYASDEAGDRIAERLRRALPPTIAVRRADELFAPGSLGRQRLGEVVLVASGDEFMTWSGEIYEHGSVTDGELYVPFAEWEG